MKENWQVNGAVIGVSAVAWVAAFTLHNHFLSVVTHAPGIDLVFIPSGIRLIALMIGGLWAALGISFGALFLTGSEFNTTDLGVILAIAACAGFCPYVALRVTLGALGIKRGLGNLQPLHLPMISLGVALGSALLHNVVFCALGLASWQVFADHVIAMAAGDFLGTLLAVVTVYLVLRFLRPRAG